MENILKSIREETTLLLGENELKKLSNYMDTLKKQSIDGERYRKMLCENTKKGFALAIPEVEENCVDEILKNLSTDNLEKLCDAISKKATSVAPISSQLYVEEKSENNSNSEFKF